MTANTADTARRGRPSQTAVLVIGDWRTRCGSCGGHALPEHRACESCGRTFDRVAPARDSRDTGQIAASMRPDLRPVAAAHRDRHH